MHVYYFITPVTVSPGHNPGCSFITYGAKYLISQADPGSALLDVSITEHSKQSWDILLDQAHCLVFAGNPRYNPSDVRSYWDYDIWDHIQAAQMRGILVADLWGGSAYSLPLQSIDAMASDMLRFSRNKRTLSFQSKLDMVTTRDPCAQHILSSVRSDCALFPCSSFWASRWACVSSTSRPYNCVVLRYVKDEPWVIESLFVLSQILARDRKTFFLCHAGYEYWWAKEHFPDIKNLICIFDPLSLLKFYAQCDKVISMRLHGSIPALSLGCQVINVATDSRCLAFDYFGFHSVPYTALKHSISDLSYSQFHSLSVPGPGEFISLFKSNIVSRL
jgi:hypothetical protein